MDIEKLKARFRETRADIQRIQAEQSALPYMPAPDYVPPIGAYADDDPDAHNADHQDRPKQVKERA